MNPLNLTIEFLPSLRIFFYLKIIFIIFALFSLAGIILLLFKNSWTKRRFLEDWTEFFTYRPFGAKKTFKQWQKILQKMETNQEPECKLAVIEADSLLNEVLGKAGYSGETTGERLKQLDSTILPNIDEVWQAHKTRNNIVHDPDYRLTLDQTKKALAIYEQTLRELEMF